MRQPCAKTEGLNSSSLPPFCLHDPYTLRRYGPICLAHGRQGGRGGLGRAVAFGACRMVYHLHGVFRVGFEDDSKYASPTVRTVSARTKSAPLTPRYS